MKKKTDNSLARWTKVIMESGSDAREYRKKHRMDPALLTALDFRTEVITCYTCGVEGHMASCTPGAFSKLFSATHKGHDFLVSGIFVHPPAVAGQRHTFLMKWYDLVHSRKKKGKKQ